MRYKIIYGSDQQYQRRIESNSRDAKRHGQELLGTAGGGYVEVRNRAGALVSAARYTPEGAGHWFSTWIR